MLVSRLSKDSRFDSPRLMRGDGLDSMDLPGQIVYDTLGSGVARSDAYEVMKP